MFKLDKIKVMGLQGFESGLEIECNPHLTVLIGPNGSGKTTSLSVIYILFSFLNKCIFDDEISPSSNWTKWDSSDITFTNEDTFQNDESELSDLGTEFKEITISITNISKNLYITKLQTETGALEIKDFENIYLNSENLVSLEKNHQEHKQNESSLVQQINDIKRSNPQHPNLQTMQPKLDDLRKKIADTERLIQIEKIELINFSETNVHRKSIRKFLENLKLPIIKFIKFGDTDFSNIKETIRKISELRGGEEPDSKYKEIKSRLYSIIQQDPHFFHRRGEVSQDFLKIDGVDYEHVSTGTKICIFYFSLIFESGPNDVILWDEPENGLHPTRRYKILDLILNDTRQFIIATHSTELAPIFNNNAYIIRTHCEHREIDNKNYIHFMRTKDKIDAFKIADKLGLSPSRLLFTASVTIWVEGPSDMIFWRKMLQLHPDGKDLVEGFDYSFLLYGGKVSAPVTASVPEQLPCRFYS